MSVSTRSRGPSCVLVHHDRGEYRRALHLLHRSQTERASTCRSVRTPSWSEREQFLRVQEAEVNLESASRLSNYFVTTLGTAFSAPNAFSDDLLNKLFDAARAEAEKVMGRSESSSINVSNRIRLATIDRLRTSLLVREGRLDEARKLLLESRARWEAIGMMKSNELEILFEAYHSAVASEHLAFLQSSMDKGFEYLDRGIAVARQMPTLKLRIGHLASLSDALRVFAQQARRERRYRCVATILGCGFTDVYFIDGDPSSAYRSLFCAEV